MSQAERMERMKEAVRAKLAAARAVGQDAKPGAKPGAKSGAKAEAKPKPRADAASKAGAKPKPPPDAKAKAKSKPKGDVASKPPEEAMAKAKSNPKGQAKPKPPADAKAEAPGTPSRMWPKPNNGLSKPCQWQSTATADPPAKRKAPVEPPTVAKAVKTSPSTPASAIVPEIDDQRWEEEGDEQEEEEIAENDVAEEEENDEQNEEDERPVSTLLPNVGGPPVCLGPPPPRVRGRTVAATSQAYQAKPRQPPPRPVAKTEDVSAGNEAVVVAMAVATAVDAVPWLWPIRHLLMLGSRGRQSLGWLHDGHRGTKRQIRSHAGSA